VPAGSLAEGDGETVVSPNPNIICDYMSGTAMPERYCGTKWAPEGVNGVKRDGRYFLNDEKT